MPHMQSVTSGVLLLCLATNAGLVDASIFLEKVPVHLQNDVELEHVLLSELEEALGSEHRTFTETRLGTIKQVVGPVFAALPKNEFGKLGSAATSYALYRVFLARHAWFMTGLEPFKAMATWNASSPTSVMDQRVPEFITGLFDTRLGKGGFGVHELAVLAATLEHLVHKESLIRLNAAYRSLEISNEDVLGEEDARNLMDTYMALYVLGPLVRNMSKVSKTRVRGLRANITRMYPGFPETQQFLRDVQQSVAPTRDSLYYSDMASLVEEVGDRYGRWQDHECRVLKDLLVGMEDPGAGGAGRVRLGDFYDAALNHGKWQLGENVNYLRQLGALDESNPDNLRIIIANYVNGPSNCVASSNYYSVCCVNECVELLGHIETKIAAPDATPEKIIEVVGALPSSTVAGDRKMSSWLVHRLHEVANHHGGLVPLHGRLFGQWMHYAYPRECPFPHVLGTAKPQTAEDWVRETRQEFTANKTEMQHYISLPAPHQRRTTDTSEIEEVLSVESAMWTMEEELVVWRPAAPAQKATFGSWIRGAAFVAAFSATLFAVKHSGVSKLKDSSSNNEKYFV